MASRRQQRPRSSYGARGPGAGGYVQRRLAVATLIEWSVHSELRSDRVGHADMLSKRLDRRERRRGRGVVESQVAAGPSVVVGLLGERERSCLADQTSSARKKEESFVHLSGRVGDWRRVDLASHPPKGGTETCIRSGQVRHQYAGYKDTRKTTPRFAQQLKSQRRIKSDSTMRATAMRNQMQMRNAVRREQRRDR
jgi:hypothetical protein